jgi:3-hydroxyacyl-CoA dehydrogenase/enoyl-CoA hydratase/3-hydroxybutyryl-CoA epimerase
MATDGHWRHWRLERDAGDLAWLTFDRADSSVNSLSRDVLEELGGVLAGLAERLPAALVIRSGKAGGFIAGADVREFTAIADREEALALIRRGQGILSRIEALPVPTIALIHGFCLGGGLELALACRYRVASDDPATRLGLPEVQLGIHPGFGGTLRLTRRIGPLRGLELILTGRTVTARAAQTLGLVDVVTAERQLINAARALTATPPGPPSLPFSERLAALAPAKGVVAGLLRRQVAKRADRRHYPAPYALLDLWRGFTGNAPLDYAAEAASVAGLITGDTARNLTRAFLLQERLKAAGRGEAVAPSAIHVVGGGLMGGDIAICCALHGLRVTIQDLDRQRLGQVVKRAHPLFARILKEHRAIEAASDRLIPDPEGYGAARAELVIEAIFEDADAKRALFRQLEPRLRPDAILASNTSSIPLEELAGALARPERLIGLHFFNPVDRMQLVEVVASSHSAPDLVQRGAAFVLAVKHLPLPVKSLPGFLVNRVLMPYLLEAVTLAGEEVDPAVIDRAATDFGMPMGPLRLADTVGLDICLAVARILAQHYPVEVPARLTELVGAGRLGRKSGRGFYDYTPGEQQPSSRPRSVPAEIGSRLMLRLLNEAVACWREKVTTDADLLDAGISYGTGFAPFRGGPMQHIAAADPARLLTELETLANRHGRRFTPDPGWQQLLARKAEMP